MLHLSRDRGGGGDFGRVTKITGIAPEHVQNTQLCTDARNTLIYYPPVSTHPTHTHFVDEDDGMAVAAAAADDVRS